MCGKTAQLVFLMMVSLVLGRIAQAMDAPTGTVILTISGAIGVDNTPDTDGKATVEFDLAMIEEIGMTKVTTRTTNSDEVVTFEGVLVRDLLALIAPEGVSVRAHALDDYTINIPIEDFHNNDVIVATRADGKIMGIRDNGPLRVIYPFTDVPDLNRAHYFSRSLWMLRSLTVLPK